MRAQAPKLCLGHLCASCYVIKLGLISQVRVYLARIKTRQFKSQAGRSLFRGPKSCQSTCGPAGLQVGPGTRRFHRKFSGVGQCGEGQSPACCWHFDPIKVPKEATVETWMILWLVSGPVIAALWLRCNHNHMTCSGPQCSFFIAVVFILSVFLGPLMGLMAFWICNNDRRAAD